MVTHPSLAPSDLPQHDQVYVERRRVAAGEHVPLHWHDYCEWEIVLSGRGEQVYNARRYPMQRGTAYLLTQEAMHALWVEEEVELLKIQFHEYALPGPAAQMLAAHRGDLYFSLEEEELQQMVSLWAQIERELAQRRPLYPLLVQGAVTAAVVPLLRRVEGQGAPLPGVLQQAIAEVHTRFRTALTLCDVAAHCAVTSNYLGRLFSRWMRVSFSDYLNTVRLRYACQLLRGTGMSVQEVAFSSGYASSAYFQYVFRRRFSVTPLTYRRQGNTQGASDP